RSSRAPRGFRRRTWSDPRPDLRISDFRRAPAGPGLFLFWAPRLVRGSFYFQALRGVRYSGERVRSNSGNFLSLLIVVGIFIAVMIAGLAGNVRSGNYLAIPVVFTAFAIAGLAIWLSHFRVRLLLREKTPDRIIAHYRSSVRRIPHANAA